MQWVFEVLRLEGRPVEKGVDPVVHVQQIGVAMEGPLEELLEPVEVEPEVEVEQLEVEPLVEFVVGHLEEGPTDMQELLAISN